MAFNLDAETLSQITSGTWYTSPAEGWTLSRIDRLDLALRRKTIRKGTLLYSRNPDRDLERLRLSTKSLHGAVLAIGSDHAKTDLGLPTLSVGQVDEAIQAIGRAARDHYKGKIIAITGSVGKTTTKNLLAHTLANHRDVYVKLDNQNGLRSIINRVLELDAHDVAIFEVARIALPDASTILRPDIAIITGIAEAHMSDLDSLENTAEVKASLFHGMDPGSTAIINIDAPYADTLVRTAEHQRCNVVTYSAKERADLYIKDYDPQTRVVDVISKNDDFRYTLSLFGVHNALNSLSVLGTLEALGEEVKKYLSSLETFEAVKARGALVETTVEGRTILIVDDSYNANPTSMKASIESFGLSFPDRRKILVLGDMLELGSNEDYFHADLADTVLRLNPSRVYLVGPLMTHLWHLLPEEQRGAHVMNSSSLLKVVPDELEDGDAMMVKASNGTGLGSLVQAWTSPKEPKESWRLHIKGEIQGVGFRKWWKGRARTLHIDGWVRNRSDGQVETLIHGDRANLAELMSELRHSPTPASVSRIEVVFSNIKPRSGFRVRKNTVVGDIQPQPPMQLLKLLRQKVKQTTRR